MPTQSKVVVNKAKYPVIDQAVFQWFCSRRSLRVGCKPLPLPTRGEIRQYEDGKGMFTAGRGVSKQQSSRDL